MDKRRDKGYGYKQQNSGTSFSDNQPSTSRGYTVKSTANEHLKSDLDCKGNCERHSILRSTNKQSLTDERNSNKECKRCLSKTFVSRSNCDSDDGEINTKRSREQPRYKTNCMKEKDLENVMHDKEKYCQSCHLRKCERTRSLSHSPSRSSSRDYRKEKSYRSTSPKSGYERSRFYRSNRKSPYHTRATRSPENNRASYTPERYTRRSRDRKCDRSACRNTQDSYRNRYCEKRRSRSPVNFKKYNHLPSLKNNHPESKDYQVSFQYNTLPINYPCFNPGRLWIPRLEYFPRGILPPIPFAPPLIHPPYIIPRHYMPMLPPSRYQFTPRAFTGYNRPPGPRSFTKNSSATSTIVKPTTAE